jgi:uncharacterized protein (TIGR02996 family)
MSHPAFTTDDRAFLRGIMSNPAELTAWLVYADWLDEHDDPARAEFIRVQCERARLPEDSPQRRGLLEREEALFRRHGDAWLGPWERLHPEATFERGFLTGLSIRYYARVPLGELAEAVAPYLRHLEKLTLEWNTLTTGLLEALAADPPRNLSALEVRRCRRGNAAVKAVAGFPRLARLTRVRMTEDHIGPAALKSLAKASCLESVRALDLSYNPLGASGANTLAGCPRLDRLTTLHLNGANVGDAGAAALSASPHLAALTTLGLRHNNIGDVGARALATSPYLVRLTSLDLTYNAIGAAGAAALAASRTLARLPSLDLSGNPRG